MVFAFSFFASTLSMSDPVQTPSGIPLEPIYGPADPDIDEVDVHVRAVMQTALDELARERRFPVLG